MFIFAAGRHYRIPYIDSIFHRKELDYLFSKHGIHVHVVPAVTVFYKFVIVNTVLVASV
jgi:hypothetical protein